MGYVQTNKTVKKIIRLAKKHHQQAENGCNGRGWLNGKFYTLAKLDAQELAQYPHAIDGYINHEGNDWPTYFDRAMEQYEGDIKSLLPKGFTVEFQGDPRGYTVRIKDEEGNLIIY